VGTKSINWLDILSNNDVEALWYKLYDLVSRHSSVRMLYPPGEYSRESLKDTFCDLTQDLLLRLYTKNRCQYYLDQGYSNEKIQQELYRIEVPNMIAHLQREQHPESYRIARRISDLIQTRPEFQHYTNGSSKEKGKASSGGSNNKMVLKLFGLSKWPLDKPIKDKIDSAELIKDVAFRNRNIRRTGRGGGSQVVISNEELLQLIVDVFTAVDTPLAVRTMRALVMSKLSIEDSKPISIDAGTWASSHPESESLKLDLQDDRPTPLELLLEKEVNLQIEDLAEEILREMKDSVRNKPKRYNKLVRVVWHCYFDPTSLTQTRIAQMLGISESLVSHYRTLFDKIIRSLDLRVNEFILFNSALATRLATIIPEVESTGKRRPSPNADPIPKECFIPSGMKTMARSATRGSSLHN
jgi:hypothetical protein